jgi:hypothetical protein
MLTSFLPGVVQENKSLPMDMFILEDLSSDAFRTFIRLCLTYVVHGSYDAAALAGGCTAMWFNSMSIAAYSSLASLGNKR